MYLILLAWAQKVWIFIPGMLPGLISVCKPLLRNSNVNFLKWWTTTQKPQNKQENMMFLFNNPKYLYL